MKKSLLFLTVLAFLFLSFNQKQRLKINNIESGWTIPTATLLEQFNNLSENGASHVSISKSSKNYFLSFWIDESIVFSYELDKNGEDLYLSKKGGVFTHGFVGKSCASCKLEGKVQYASIRSVCSEEECNDCKCNHQLTYSTKLDGVEKSKLFKALKQH